MSDSRFRIPLHGLILIAVTRKYLKQRIMYSYGHPGSFNPTVKPTKEAHVIYGNMNNEIASSANYVGQMQGAD